MIGWGWFYLSSVRDDFSRYILAWKHCTTMTAGDVSDTLDMALKAAGEQTRGQTPTNPFWQFVRCDKFKSTI